MDQILATQFLFCCFFAVFVLQLRPAICQDEVEDESEFDYVKGSDKGPERWGEIHPEWKMCSHGSMQSPIDLLDKRVEIVSNLGRLNRKYKPSNATLKNRGHDMMLKWEGDAGYIRINGSDYQLQQLHWHSPSEHTINGKTFDLEVHMVHKNRQGDVSVFGILYKIGRADSFLSLIKNDLEIISANRGAETVVGVINPREVKIGSRKYYRYVGSLTTPPCTQNVVWTISKKVRTVAREQVRLIRQAVHDDSQTNARPIQPVNGRIVKLYKPRKTET